MSGGVSSGGLSSGSTSPSMGGGSSGPGATGGLVAPAPNGGVGRTGALAGAAGTGGLPAGGQSAPTTEGGAGAAAAEPNGGLGRTGLATIGISKAEGDQWYVNTDPAGDTMQGLLTTPYGPLQTSAAEGNTLTWGPEGLYVPPPPERQTLEYRYSTNTAMADPGAGVLRANGATGPTTTALAFDVLTDGGRDASILLRTLRAGDHAYVQDKDDSSHWTRFTITAPAVDRTGWFEAPVAHVDGSATSPGNNARVDVAFTLSPPSTPTAEQDYARLLIATTAPPGPTPPFDAFWFNPEETA